MPARPLHRSETRFERYSAKAANAVTYPVSLATVNFNLDDNIGFLARACACFGASSLHIIGRTPSYAAMNRFSAGTAKFLEIVQHSRPDSFLRFAREGKNGPFMVSAELCDRARPLSEVKLVQPNKHTYIIIGNEETGVPEEFLVHSDEVIYIPMDGPGFSANASQCGNILLYEYVRQFKELA